MTGGENSSGALRSLLRMGAVYDWILATVILTLPPGLLALLGLPPPPDPFAFRMMALPLISFGVLYWMVGADPAGRRWGVRLSIGIRLLGGLFVALLAMIHDPPGKLLFLVAALIDVVWGSLWASAARSG